MKKKLPEQPGSPFSKKSFKSPKGPAPSAAKSTGSPGQKKISNRDEDDFSLFLRAVEGARRVNPGADTPVNPTSSVADRIVAPDDNHVFLSAMRKSGPLNHDTSQKEESEDTGQRSSSSRMRQLKSGVIRITQSLDLHGVLKDEALRQLARFVTHASGRGHQAVLVITGKGINSPEGPVLRGAVDEWLRNTGKTLVAEFSKAPRELGGSGAFVVFLKKK